MADKCGSQFLVRKVFLCGVGLVYLFAFSSLYFQIPGLYGRYGLMPAKLVLKQEYSTLSENYADKPTLLWFSPYLGLDIETGMDLLCLVGMAISFLCVSMATWCDSVTFFFLWYLYYSLYQVGQTFLWFQWDILLLEAGFLAILVAPLPISYRSHHHDNITLWLVKWLAFRLLFCSGVVKLTSECPTWWGLTALDWHYESQCIPTPLAWYAHQLPRWFQKLSIVFVYTILMVFSWLFFAPLRTLRIFSFYSQIFFQVLIILTGNYNFFNILAIIILLPVLDDKHLQTILPSFCVYRQQEADHQRPKPSKLKQLVAKVVSVAVIGYILHWMVKLFDVRFSEKHIVKTKIKFSKNQFYSAIEKYTPISIWMGLVSLCLEILYSLIGCLREKGLLRKLWTILQWGVFSLSALGMFAISLVPYSDIDYNTQQNIWPVIKRIKSNVDYLELVHAYGLFRRMTGVGGRPELNIEGSNSLDGPWKEYGFLYKPVEQDSPLPFVAPHQPRLDWQMWFAALGSYNHNPWFVHLAYRLLHGQKEVLDLMGKNPFPGKPPRYIRANLYMYRYTKLHKNTTNIIEAIDNSRLIKNWWKREFKREYLPVLDKTEPTLISWLNQFGYAKDDPWPENPSGNFYLFVRAVRRALQTKQPEYFMLSIFLCAFFSKWIIDHHS